MSQHTPQNPQPPAGQYGTGQPPSGDPPPDQPPSGQYPPTQPPGTPYPPGEPPTGQYPPNQPPAYPPTQPPTGQYPPTQPPSYPPTQPPTGQYPPTQPPSYPPTQPPTGQYPPTQPPSYPPTQPPTGQYPPTQPPSYPPTQPPTGQYPPTQQPPTTKCPDPCDKDQPWGPPKIDATCYPTDSCCDPAPAYLAWDEVDDPCARASSAGCKVKSTRLSCECKSTNAECTCEEWDCGGFPDGMCVPCKPCEGLIPEDSDDTPTDDGCKDPERNGCSSDTLRRQLEANKKCITSKQTEKARLEAEIKARQDRDKELAALIAGFDTIIDKYKAERHKLVCREDCLKGFYRDTAKIFDDATRFPQDCKAGLQTAINEEWCKLELAKCCQKNLEWKLEKATRLIWEQKEAEKGWKKAEDAFALIKDLPKWMTDQFNELEKLKDQIATALNDRDPQKHKWAFYLFYWKFAPSLCKRFKVAICCQPPQTPTPGYPTTAGTTTPVPTPSTHIGCEPGDWHPSKIAEDTLRKLICCAWDYVKAEKTKYQEATAAIDTAKQHLEFIKKKVDDDGKGLEDRIRTRLDQVVCGAASSR